MSTPSETSPSLAVKRVRRAYEQVADQLRQWILSGELRSGDRLPSEAELAAQFRTSRGTVREALRILASESLVSTRPGAGGGSTVALPRAEKISNVLHGTLSLLIGSEELSPDELLLAREIIEVPAASLAAQQRSSQHVEQLAGLLPDRPGSMDPEALFDVDRAFHETLLQASGNRLLSMLCTPLYEVLAYRFRRRQVGGEFWEGVVAQHRDIATAVTDGDGDAASSAMSLHLQDLRQVYRRIYLPEPSEPAEAPGGG